VKPLKKKKKKSKKRVKTVEKQPSTSEEYEKYVQSVKTLDELFLKATKSFSIVADELKKEIRIILLMAAATGSYKPKRKL
jgi:hypothetical protein